MKKNVIAKFNIKLDSVDTYVKLTENLIMETRKENGCLFYKLYKELAGDENEFLFYEIYEDEKALQFHMNSQYLKQFLNNISDLLLEEPTVEIHNLN